MRYAVINDVTGEEYAGTLEQDEAEELFIRLMGALKHAKPRQTGGIRRAFRKSYTFPMDTSKTVIRKASQRK